MSTKSAFQADMVYRGRWCRSSDYGMTRLEVSGTDYDLEVKLLSRAGKRSRRAFVLGFFRQIRPWLEFVKRTSLSHTTQESIRSDRPRFHRIRDVESASLATIEGKFGYEIRAKRLKFGWSQSELARKIGIQRSHLSDIERGIHFPGPGTREAIRKALEVQS